MRRLGLLLLMLTALVVIRPASARADFHPACSAGDGFATVTLRSMESPPTFRFSGMVNCTGAEIAITSVTLKDLGTNTILGTVSKKCAPGLGPCRVSETVSSSVGEFEVMMLFDVDDLGTPAKPDFPGVERRGVFRKLTMGPAIPVCIPFGFFPGSVGQCGPGGATLGLRLAL